MEEGIKKTLKSLETRNLAASFRKNGEEDHLLFAKWPIEKTG